MGDAPEEIQICHITNCLKADPAYGKGLTDTLGISLGEVSRCCEYQNQRYNYIILVRSGF